MFVAVCMIFIHLQSLTVHSHMFQLPPCTALSCFELRGKADSNNAAKNGQGSLRDFKEGEDGHPGTLVTVA